MAFPYIHEANFQSGDASEWDSQAASVIDFPHYSELARIGAGTAPYRGAYCARAILTGGTTTDYLEEGDMNISDGGTAYWGAYWYFGNDLVMANNDQFEIMQLQSTTPTDEVVVAVRYTTASGFQIGIGETAGEDWATLPQGRWVHVEIRANIEDDSEGNADLLLDGVIVAQVIEDTHAAIVQGRIGVIGPDSGTSGTVYFAESVFDDTEVFPQRQDRFRRQTWFTKSGHLFMGPGWVENASLFAGAGTDCVLELYDTDVASTAGGPMARLQNNANNQMVQTPEAEAPIGPFVRGCYVSLAGTTPRALATVKSASGWGSDGAIANYGRAR